MSQSKAHRISSASQAAPPMLRRCKLSASAKGGYSTSIVGQQQQAGRLRLRWETEEDIWQYWPGERQTASAAELTAAVRDFAEARGIAVMLADNGRCVVFDRT